MYDRFKITVLLIRLKNVFLDIFRIYLTLRLYPPKDTESKY